MDPNVRVFVQALRVGKNETKALEQYCWAKCAVPIEERDLEACGDAFKFPPALYNTWSSTFGVEAFEAGADDEEIALGFERGLRRDHKNGVVWRALKEEEWPTAGQLVRALPVEDLLKAGEIFGNGKIARVFVDGDTAVAEGQTPK
jgi:hypothetical protein